MKKHILRAIVICLLAGATLTSSLLPPVALYADSQPPATIVDHTPAGAGLRPAGANGPLPTDQIIVKYRPEMLGAPAVAAANAQMDRLTRAAGIELSYFRPMSGDAHVLKLPAPLPEDEVATIASRLAALPEVEYAEPDRIALPTGPAAVPNDPQYSNQWYLSGTYGINAPAAWDVTTGSSTIIVAVIDTGIVFGHPDLSGRTINGYDFITDSSRANDDDGRDTNAADPGDWVAADVCGVTRPARNSSWHGTHVAGTIGAATNNSTGIAGVNWNARMLAVRVLGRCGGVVSDIADGIRWSAGLAVSGVPNNANPARVLNMSLGGSSATCQTAYQNAINDARNANAVVVVAAGNDSMDAGGQQPANCAGVVTVAATTNTGGRAGFSNFGSVVDISAPGVDIRSTVNGSKTSPNSTHTYDDYDGTSMATPQVAGVASLILSLRPQLSPGDVESILRSSVTAFPSGSSCNTSNCGTGILNAEEAVRDLWVWSAWPSIPGSPSIGSSGRPYKTVTAANQAAWNGARLRIRPGSYPGAVTISKQVELRAEGGLITIGQ